MTLKPAFLALIASALTACSQRDPQWPVTGDPAAGRAAMERLQCGACHEIPGIGSARGRVGPPLDRYARRVYIAGKFPQDPAILARWIADAPALAPGTAMPAIPMSADEARNMAAYLHTLK
jgi:cytochrome c